MKYFLIFFHEDGRDDDWIIGEFADHDSACDAVFEGRDIDTTFIDYVIESESPMTISNW